MLYRVTMTSTTLASILVEAENQEQAEEIAQKDHVDFGKEEVDSIHYQAELENRLT